MTEPLPFPVDVTGVHALLKQLQELGVLSEIDRHFASCLSRLTSTADPSVIVAAALTSRAVQAGHVCLDLDHLRTQPLLDADENPVSVEWPALDDWSARLSASPLVLSDQRAIESDSEPRPLWLDDSHRLFLQRYGNYQRRLVEGLLALAHPVPLDEQTLANGLDRYFPDRNRDPFFDGQAFAALLAARSAFSVISGGPGTGKTTTVARLLLLLLDQQRARNLAPLRTWLLAPTGKAAQRLSESLEASLKRLNVDEDTVRALPNTASTIHRALGYNPRTPTRFRHNAARPLSADLIVVDEASMVDLALMTKLVEAVPPHARLILLGDKDQLASVEAGAIFGDIFNETSTARYSSGLLTLSQRVGLNVTAADAPRSSPIQARLSDCTVHLHRSYRYNEDGGIGKLAAALRRGDVEETIGALGDESEATWTRTDNLDEKAVLDELKGAIADGYREYFATRDPGERLHALSRFRVLCAHRRGSLGVEGINQLVEQSMPHAGDGGGAYDGRPIMVTQNDYQLELFNGDVGVLCRDGSRLAAFFDSASGLRRVQLSRLPGHETVFAMTVHKSQGSEFESVALVLPERPSPVFTRELLYTGVTRAKSSVRVFGSRAVLADGIRRPIHRSSGLKDALWR